MPRNGKRRDSASKERPATDRDPFFGRMNAPTASAYLRGVCGDEMEYYLDIREGVIQDVKYYTEACESARVCGQAVAEAAKGKSVSDALAINPRDIIHSCKCLPEEGRHCAILAVTALYRAIADFLLAP